MVELIAAAAFVLAPVTRGTPPERFIAEPMADFSVAYQKYSGMALDASHLDQHKYHAYRVAERHGVVVVIASAVLRDSRGQLQLTPERGAIAIVKKTSARGYVHVLLPRSVTPPR